MMTLFTNYHFAGLGGFPDNSFPFPWHVHEYPFPHDGVVTPCGVGITGGHFDPLGAIQNPNYATDCSMQNPQNCEIGDLSGKFEHFTQDDPLTRQYSDPFLSLYGVNSIIGRSVVIHFMNGTRLVCANIGYPDSNSQSIAGGLLYSPFRNNFAGNIFFRQHRAGTSDASVYTDLVRLIGEINSSGHNWHVHRDPLDADGQDCSIAGPHYNPRNVDITPPGYLERCGNANSSLQMNCEIGDLSNKGSPFDVVNRRIQQFYTDTDLPLLGDADGYFIDNRSVVIHAPDRGAPRIACTNLTQYQPLEAVSIFNENGVSGSIRFYQRSPYDPTRVVVNLRGLRQMADGYHVHEYPVGPESLGSPSKCSGMYAGGHWNPTNVTSSGTTSDQFEIGDLSGKFGGLSRLSELSAEYTDPNIPLFGSFSVIGRSIVIHRDEPDGPRWVCSDIQRTREVLQITTMFSTDSFSGNVTFSQPADDPYAETTITVVIDVLQMIEPPVMVASSTPGPVEVSSSPVAITTSSIAMTTSSAVMTSSLDMTTSAVSLVSNSMVVTTSSVMMTSSQAPIVRPSTSTMSQALPTSFTSRPPLLEPTPAAQLTSTTVPQATLSIGAGSGDRLMPYSEESTGKCSLIYVCGCVVVTLVHV